MTTYQLFKNGHQSGPFQEKQILALLRSGVIDESDLIWADGWTEWQRLSEAFIIETEVAEQKYEHEPAVNEVGAGAYSYSASSAASQHELAGGVVLQGMAPPVSLPPVPPLVSGATAGSVQMPMPVPMPLPPVPGVQQSAAPQPIKGRMGRGGYLIAVIILYVCDAVLALTMIRMGGELHERVPIAFMLAAAIMLVPTIMRARDAGVSVLWGFLPLIPVVQTVTLTYFLAQQPLELKNDKRENTRRNWRQIGYFIFLVTTTVVVHYIILFQLKRSS